MFYECFYFSLSLHGFVKLVHGPHNAKLGRVRTAPSEWDVVLLCLCQGVKKERHLCPTGGHLSEFEDDEKLGISSPKKKHRTLPIFHRFKDTLMTHCSHWLKHCNYCDIQIFVELCMLKFIGSFYSGHLEMMEVVIEVGKSFVAPSMRSAKKVTLFVLRRPFLAFPLSFPFFCRRKNILSLSRGHLEE